MPGVTIHVQTKNYNDATRARLIKRMVRLAAKHVVQIDTFRTGKTSFQQFHPITPQQENAIEVALRKSCLNYAKIVH